MLDCEMKLYRPDLGTTIVWVGTACSVQAALMMFVVFTGGCSQATIRWVER